jgi:hypothetical protein
MNQQVPTWWWVPEMHYLSGIWKWESAKCFTSTPKSWTFLIKLSLKWSCLWSPLSLWVFFPCYKMWVQFTGHCSLDQWIHYFSISSSLLDLWIQSKFSEIALSIRTPLVVDIGYLHPNKNNKNLIFKAKWSGFLIWEAKKQEFFSWRGICCTTFIIVITKMRRKNQKSKIQFKLVLPT